MTKYDKKRCICWRKNNEHTYMSKVVDKNDFYKCNLTSLVYKYGIWVMIVLFNCYKFSFRFSRTYNEYLGWITLNFFFWLEQDRTKERSFSFISKPKVTYSLIIVVIIEKDVSRHEVIIFFYNNTPVKNWGSKRELLP